MSKRKYGVSPKILRSTELRRVNKIRDEWIAKGYVVLTNEQFHSGVDLIVVDTSNGTFNIVRAIESTNWNKRGYLNKSRFNRYMDSLNKFKPTTREIHFSYKSNLSSTQKKGYENAGIEVKIVGHQE